MEDAGVKYCHWKSNEHLHAGLKGDTDLDILVDRKHANRFYCILNECFFIKGDTVSYLNYSSIEDYIGFDKSQGKMIHLHVHFELMIGKKFVKGIRLPWERVILNSSLIDKDYNVRIIDPNIELLLLIVRNFFKRYDLFRLPNLCLTKDDKIEFSWLLERFDIDKLCCYSSALVNDSVAKLLGRYVTGESCGRALYRELRRYYRYSYGLPRYPFALKYFLHKTYAAVNVIRAKKLSAPIPYRRTLSEGGLIIAFIGVDGAGKSTHIKKTYDWLSWKLDIKKLYFGSGDGQCSLSRLPLKIIAQKIVKKRGPYLGKPKEEVETKKSSSKLRLARLIWAISLAFEKRKKFMKMLKARSQGCIVLSDRFPQTQFCGYNDGPLLTEWFESKSAIKQKIAKWEYNIYDLARLHTPDLVIKLLISKELSAERKDDTPMYMIENKINVIKGLQFAEETDVIEIESSGDPAVTSLKIKDKIWNFIGGDYDH